MGQGPLPGDLCEAGHPEEAGAREGLGLQRHGEERTRAQGGQGGREGRGMEDRKDLKNFSFVCILRYNHIFSNKAFSTK